MVRNSFQFGDYAFDVFHSIALKLIEVRKNPIKRSKQNTDYQRKRPKFGEQNFQTPIVHRIANVTIYSPSPHFTLKTQKNHQKSAFFGGFLRFFTFGAEKEGFEPPEALTPQRFSRPPQSTTLPFLRCKSTNFSASASQGEKND